MDARILNACLGKGNTTGGMNVPELLILARGLGYDIPDKITRAEIQSIVCEHYDFFPQHEETMKDTGLTREKLLEDERATASMELIEICKHLISEIIKKAEIYSAGKRIDVEDLIPAMNLELFGAFRRAETKETYTTVKTVRMIRARKHSLIDISSKIPSEKFTSAANSLLVTSLTEYMTMIIERTVMLNGRLTARGLNKIRSNIKEYMKPLTSIDFRPEILELSASASASASAIMPDGLEKANNVVNLMLNYITEGLRVFTVDEINTAVMVLFNDNDMIFELVKEQSGSKLLTDKLRLPAHDKKITDYLAHVLSGLIILLIVTAEGNSSGREDSKSTSSSLIASDFHDQIMFTF